MKKIVQYSQPEIANYFCDICGKPAVSCLVWVFRYGSSRDLDKVIVEFCDDCGEKVLKTLKKKVPNLIKSEREDPGF